MKKEYSVFILLFLFFVTGCQNADSETYISEINEARHSLANVDNGQFRATLSLNREEKTEKETIEGKFVIKEDDIDWYTSLIVDDSKEGRATLTEYTSFGLHQYQRFGRINQDEQYIDENEEVIEELEWIVVGQNDTHYPSTVTPLVQLDLDETMINEMTKEESGESVSYIIHLSDNYLTQLRDREIRELEDNLEYFKNITVHPDVITELETNLDYQRTVTYEEMVLTITVDSDGVLIGYETETQAIEQAEGGEKQSIQSVSKVEITEYNQSNIVVEPVI